MIARSLGRNLLAICLLMAPVAALWAQPPGTQRTLSTEDKRAIKFYEEGINALRFRQFQTGVENLNKALDRDPDFVEALYAKANLYLNLYSQGMPGDSILPVVFGWLERVVALDPNAFPKAHLDLADWYMDSARYAQALRHYGAFINLVDPREQAVQHARQAMRHAEWAAQHVHDTVPFDPHNLGPNVNSPGMETMPALTVDGQRLFFTSRRRASIGGPNDEDFYICRRQEDGSWTPAENLGPPINTPLNEGAACMSPDGQFVIYTGCNRYPISRSCDLYVARLDGDQWLEPRLLPPPINTEGYETQPYLAHDGRELFFISSRPGGMGNQDIWRATLLSGTVYDGAWSEPEPLGPTINTVGDEFLPYLAADGVSLYFASDHHLGFGSRDLFLSRRTQTGWSEPQNLGYPINSPGTEEGLFIVPSGDTAYFHSLRKDSDGRHDLYRFILPKALRPTFSTWVKGLVTEAESRKPLAATVQVVNLATGDTLRQQPTMPSTGQYMLSLPTGGRYAAFIQAPGYLYQSHTFDLLPTQDDQPQGREPYALDFRLQPIQEDYSIELRNVFFDFDESQLLPTSKVELNRIVQFLIDNPTLEVELQGHTDNQGSPAYNQELSQNRAQAVKQYLVNKGIAPNRLTAKGYGETVPVASNATEEGRAQNRRTVLRVVRVK